MSEFSEVCIDDAKGRHRSTAASWLVLLKLTNSCKSVKYKLVARNPGAVGGAGGGGGDAGLGGGDGERKTSPGRSTRNVDIFRRLPLLKETPNETLLLIRLAGSRIWKVSATVAELWWGWRK